MDINGYMSMHAFKDKNVSFTQITLKQYVEILILDPLLLISNFFKYAHAFKHHLYKHYKPYQKVSDTNAPFTVKQF